MNDEKALTRWNEWYRDENLERDARILAAQPSQCARQAADLFRERDARRILDLACGVGRDTRFLSAAGFEGIGVDAAFNGVWTARRVGRGGAFVTADAGGLPFAGGALDGVYCFGLLHEFTGEDREACVRRVMDEAARVLRPGGLLVVTALAGDPQAGLPQVQLFSREMFERALRGWKVVEVKRYADIGCTGREDYEIWMGVAEREIEMRVANY
jgi:SAM-dependent methyltransferase